MNKFIDCLLYEKLLIDNLNSKLKKLTERNITPHLVTILASNNPSSQIYVNNKTKKAKKLGVKVSNYSFDRETSEQAIINLIHKLNNDSLVTGILIQLPLHQHLNENNIINAINLLKDVDGLHPLNLGNLTVNTPSLKTTNNIIPCTPLGIVYVLQREINLLGTNILMIGKSRLVGLPTANLLLQQNATVTIANSYTTNLKQLINQHQVIVVATGNPKLITHGDIQNNTIIVDVGINKLSTQPATIVGDVEISDQLLVKVKAITPAPNGIGRLTTTFLMYNIYKLSLLQNNIFDDSYDVFL